MMQTLSFACNPPTPLNHHQFRCRAAVQSLSPPTRNPASLYEVLRIKRSASSIEIKTAYRSLAKLYHPDATSLSSSSSSSSSSDGRNFMEIHNAYETLSDPAARALYDLSLGFGIGIGIGIGIEVGDQFCYSVGRRPTRRWETDQCW
ncbi:hypothetical protein BVRB_4g091130 [Beta vulgaris subsp. vulgaris]|uniref:J domain-containing protein n=1 Tax=Beta vulgaris subsp. vulgaris TaxID=3555 RepID=A0A0J8CKQ1_BETVV|nr:hypothetical protein BVRB_4g091130 [Beta vulgaris subsp. vulgaris]